MTSQPPEFEKTSTVPGGSSPNQIALFSKRRDKKSPSTSAGFTFIDLFAGIGGVRLGLERAGGKCVFSCERDRWASLTYRSWFGDDPHPDIRELHENQVPSHHVLAAGFPCQPFSIAGVSKKTSLGRAHGFHDRDQGNLFFELTRIIEAKRPPILLLENVKNLKSHDAGRTWRAIADRLQALGYTVSADIIDAAHWVPQHRERIFIVALRVEAFGNTRFEFPSVPHERPKLRDILETNVDRKYTLTDRLWKYLQGYAEKHKAKGNGFGYGLADLTGVTRTLSARYFKDGSEILIPQHGKNPRRLTPRECARLMGFPDDLEIVVSDTQAYRQFGNSVCVPVVESLGIHIGAILSKYHVTSRAVSKPA